MRRDQRSLKRGGISLLLAIAWALALSQFAGAQVLYGSLVGRVEDPSGAVVAGAKVTDYSRDGRWAGQQKTECGLHGYGI